MKKLLLQKGKKLLFLLGFVFLSGYGYSCGFTADIPNVCVGTTINFEEYTNMTKPSWKLFKETSPGYFVEVVNGSASDNFHYTFNEPGIYMIELKSYASVSFCGTYHQTFTVYPEGDGGNSDDYYICRNDSINLNYFVYENSWYCPGYIEFDGDGVEGSYFIPSNLPSSTNQVVVNFNCHSEHCGISQNSVTFHILEPPEAHFTTDLPTPYQSDSPFHVLPYTDKDGDPNAWITGIGITDVDLFTPSIGPGTYDLVLHYRDPNNGCYSEPDTKTITVNADLGYPPEAEISFYDKPNPDKVNQFYCDGDTINFQITDFNSSDYLYNIKVYSINQNGIETSLYDAAQTSNLFSFPVPNDGLNNDLKIIVTNTNAQGKSTNKFLYIHTKSLPQNPIFALSENECLNNGDQILVENNNNENFYWFSLNPVILQDNSYIFNNVIGQNTIDFGSSLCKNITLSTMSNVHVYVYPVSSNNNKIAAPPAGYIYDELFTCYSPDTISRYFSRKPEVPQLRYFDISDTSGSKLFVADGSNFNVKINNYNPLYDYNIYLLKSLGSGIIDTVLNTSLSSDIFNLSIPDDSLNNTLTLIVEVKNPDCGGCVTYTQAYFMTHSINRKPVFNLQNGSCVDSVVYISFPLDTVDFIRYYGFNQINITDSNYVSVFRKIIVNDNDTISFYDTLSFYVPDTGLMIRAKYLNDFYDYVTFSSSTIREIKFTSKEDTLQIFRKPGLNTRFYNVSDTSGTKFYVADGSNFNVKINDYNTAYNYNLNYYGINEFQIADTIQSGVINSQLFNLSIPDDSLNNLVVLKLKSVNPYGGCNTEKTYNFYTHAKPQKPIFVNIDSTCVNDTVYVSFVYENSNLVRYYGDSLSNINDTADVLQTRKIVVNNQDTINFNDSAVVLAFDLVNYIQAKFVDEIKDYKDSIQYRTVIVPGNQNEIVLFHNPKVEFSANDTMVSEGDIVHFTNESEFADGYDYIYWDFGDNSYSYEDNPFHYYYVRGPKNVVLTVNNMYSCTSSKTKYAYIYVNSNATTDAENKDVKKLKIYRLDNYLYFEFPGNDNSYKILDITGKVLVSESGISKGTVKQDISMFNSGIYILRVNNSITKKIIIK